MKVGADASGEESIHVHAVPSRFHPSSTLRPSATADTRDWQRESTECKRPNRAHWVNRHLGAYDTLRTLIVRRRYRDGAVRRTSK